MLNFYKGIPWPVLLWLVCWKTNGGGGALQETLQFWFEKEEPRRLELKCQPNGPNPQERLRYVYPRARCHPIQNKKIAKKYK
jgi:hypothetical protein